MWNDEAHVVIRVLEDDKVQYLGRTLKKGETFLYATHKMGWTHSSMNHYEDLHTMIAKGWVEMERAVKKNISRREMIGGRRKWLMHTLEEWEASNRNL